MDAKDADKRGVKRAYTKKLKQVDPQENPQGFQELRTAFEQALQMVQGSTRVTAVLPDMPPAPTPEKVETPLPPPVPAPPHQPPEQKAAPPLPVPPVPEYETKPRRDALVTLVSESQALFKQSDLRPERWRPIFNGLVDLDFNQTRLYEKELLRSFDTHLFPDGVRPSTAVCRPWLELLDKRFEWFSHGLDFQRKHPEHFKTWSYLNEIYRPPLTEKQIQKAQRKADLLRDPKVPFYLRWWFLLGGYFLLMVWAV